MPHAYALHPSFSPAFEAAKITDNQKRGKVVRMINTPQLSIHVQLPATVEASEMPIRTSSIPVIVGPLKMVREILVGPIWPPKDLIPIRSSTDV